MALLGAAAAAPGGLPGSTWPAYASNDVVNSETTAANSYAVTFVSNKSAAGSAIIGQYRPYRFGNFVFLTQKVAKFVSGTSMPAIGA